MGYYFSSYAPGQIAIPDSARVSGALSFDQLESILASDARFWSIESPLYTFEPIERVIQFICFEEDVTFDVNFSLDGKVESGKLLRGSFDTKYNPSLDVALRWLSSNGIGFSLACMGEDGALWQYLSSTGEGNYRKEELQPVTYSEASALKSAREKLQSLTQAGASAELETLEKIFGTETFQALAGAGSSESGELKIAGKVKAHFF